LRTALHVYNGPRVDSQGARLLVARLTEEKPSAIDHERLSGELLGLTCGCDRFGKKASQRTSQEDNPNNRDYQS
jgi:hypothetical protein